MNDVAVVAIGRNEGERLRACIESARKTGVTVVYVDSGSSDDSVAMARELGAEVVELDMSIPFTAARGRNAGTDFLRDGHPEIAFIQFVDGDCEIVGGWLQQARAEFDRDPKIAGVWGRRKERHPDATVYNLICDIDWTFFVRPGESETVGGDTMLRVAALREVEGYNPARIAGEERDLSIHLLRKDWKLVHLDAEMTLHDAAMTRFSQWWKRSKRSGHAFAEISHRYGAESTDWQQATRSIVIFGAVLPLAILVLAPFTFGLSFLLLAIYPVQALRVYRFMRRERLEARAARIYSVFVILSKFPSALGVWQYHWDRWRGRGGTLIEYK